MDQSHVLGQVLLLQELLLTLVALDQASGGVVVLVLSEHPGGLEPGSAVVRHGALEQFDVDERVRVGDVPGEVVAPLERLGAVRARVVPLVRVERRQVLLEQLVLGEGARAGRAQRAGEAPPDRVGAVLRQEVVAVAALGEEAVVAARGAAEAVAEVRPQVLVQIGLGLEHLGALRTGVVARVAVAVRAVLLQLRPARERLAAEAALVAAHARRRSHRRGRGYHRGWALLMLLSLAETIRQDQVGRLVLADGRGRKSPDGGGGDRGRVNQARRRRVGRRRG